MERGICSAIGDTPLVELVSLSEQTGRRIFGKCEWLNPAGSVKDRPALFLVKALEESGALLPRGTIVEGTGGNTGIGLALVAAARGYSCIVCMPETIAQEKIERMRVLGAKVVLCPSVPFTDERHYFHVSAKIAAETEGAACTQQFESLANRDAHAATTGPEIWRQTAGAVAGFCCAAGTGGTIAGVAQHLKAASEGSVQIWLADCAGSGMKARVDAGAAHEEAGEAAGKPVTWLPRSEGSSVAEGIGIGRLTANFDSALQHIDGAALVTDREAVEMAYHLLRNDGIFVGPSAALNAVGAVKLARTLPPGATVVTILCDDGGRYASKLFNAEWLAEKGLAPKITAGAALDFVA